MEEKKELLDQDERVVEIELERLRGFVNHHKDFTGLFCKTGQEAFRREDQCSGET